MFAAYDKADNAKQIAAYSMILQDIPDEILMKACHKLLIVNKFLPAIAEIVQACRHITGEINPATRERSWDEAWNEIQREVQRCGLYERMTFSTPEIEAAAKAYGLRELCQLRADEVQTASAQCRRFYEDACRRKHDKEASAYVLKNMSGAALIGLQPGEGLKRIQVIKTN